jgi:hypothetical protein
MKMANADVANVEVMEDVNIMPEHDNGIPGVNVQEDADRVKNVLVEASGQDGERKTPADNSSANKKGNDDQLGVDSLCLERKERVSQKRRTAKPSLEEQLKKLLKYTGNVSCN